MKMKQIKNGKHVKTLHCIDGIKYTSENDVHKLQVNEYEHNEGTICLVNGRIGNKQMIFQACMHH